jgi:cell division septation protein DedD
MRSLAVPTTLFLVFLAARGEGQTPTDSAAARAAVTPARPATDSIFRRARRLVAEGNGPAGRALVDSLLRAADPATPAYGDALYWHGVLASTAAEAERDYRRVIVEYPLSSYVHDALLSIAELEQARGDRAGALQHLQRFVREHPTHPSRGIAALGAARLAFEQRDQKGGCAMLTEARISAGAADVELRNQIDYYASRCTGAPVANTPGPAPAAPVGVSAPSPPARVAPVAPPPVVSTAPVAPAKASTPPRRDSAVRSAGSYTIQVAAYNTRPEAERLVVKLAARGVKARVSGSSKPFRVRLAFYRTRQEANEEVAALKGRGIIGFVTEELQSPEARAP